MGGLINHNLTPGPAASVRNQRVVSKVGFRMLFARALIGPNLTNCWGRLNHKCRMVDPRILRTVLRATDCQLDVGVAVILPEAVFDLHFCMSGTANRYNTSSILIFLGFVPYSISLPSSTLGRKP